MVTHGLCYYELDLEYEMYGKVKLTKKQIKEDKFTTFMLSAKQQITDSWQYYVIGLVVIVLVITAVVFFVDMQKSQEKEAAQIYSQGVVEFRQANNQNALLTFQRVLDEYAGTESEQLATYMLGDTNLKQRNYSEAIRFFEMYISKYSQNKLKTAASYAGIATALENQGQFADAAEKFIAAYNVDTDGPLVGDYLMSAMRNYLAVGDIDSAKIYYDDINDKFSGTNLATRAELLFAEKSKK